MTTSDPHVPISIKSNEPPTGSTVVTHLLADLVQDFADDIENLPSTKLRLKYKAEAIAHQNMLARRKTQDAIVAAELIEFRSFLRIMGPRPGPGFTIDRLNSADPEYAPQKIRWASKTEQSLNRQNITLLMGSQGIARPLTEWANDLDVSAAVLRKRKARGWSDTKSSTDARSPRQPTRPHAASTKPIKPRLTFPGPRNQRPRRAGKPTTSPSETAQHGVTTRLRITSPLPGARAHRTPSRL